MKRLEHWDIFLHDYLTARLGEPFCWGKHDCSLFAADGIAAITGVDIASEFRGKYDTRKGAFAEIRKVTGKDGVDAAIEHCAASHVIPELPNSLLAQRGDLLLIVDSGELIAGLVGMHGHALCVGETGLRRLPLSAAKRAWRI